MFARRTGFTLIELMIVVAVVAVLAALAIPNYLEAQTRSKVSAAKSNLVVVRNALEAYHVDNNAYPPVRPRIPEDPFALLADHQLGPLTTPLAYVSPTAFRDPFGYLQPRESGGGGGSASRSRTSGYPIFGDPNPHQSLMYFHYLSQSVRLNYPAFAIHGAGIVSIGPDLRDSLGGYRPFPPAFFHREFYFTEIQHPLDTVYDPTNGTISEGDISDFAGPARQFSNP